MKHRIFGHRPIVAGILFISFLSLWTAVTVRAAQDTRYKPFVLANSHATGSMSDIAAGVKKQLLANGFDVVGEYAPFQDATILIITNDRLRRHAAESEMGAFGAVQRVTITRTAAGTQISYTNPTYMAHAYNMKSDLADVSAKLANVLGHEADYGSDKGLTKDELRSYQYKWLMPYFTDRHQLASYKSQQVAIEAVEKILSTGTGGAGKVYRVDLPGKQETVMGIKLSGAGDNECSGDQYIMSRIDFKKLKSTGHLPYEIVISKGKVYVLYAEFRIAINFPDLSMMGSNSFASIMCAPGAIKTALTQAVGGKTEESEF